MEERKLLSAVVHDRGAFEELEHYINPSEDLSDIGTIIYNKVSSFYELDGDAHHVDKDVVKERINREFPKHSSSINRVIDGLQEVSPPNIVREWASLKKEQIGKSLAAALNEGRDVDVDKLMDQYQSFDFKQTEKDSQVYNGKSITDIVDHVSGDSLLPIFPRSLNDSLDGGVVAGSHIVGFARPDAGKTAFSINNACQWAKNGWKVLYVGNEDPADQMLLRIISRLSKMSKSEVIGDVGKAEELALQNGYENIVFASLAPGTFKEIAALIKDYNPDFVIIDQLRNVDVKETNKVLQLELAAQEARKLGKEYGVTVLSLTQAGDSAQDKLVLSMGDVDFSNTGIPAQADLMVGLGVDDSMHANGQIMLSICKNKVNGNYSYFPVRINHPISQLVS